MSTAELEHGNRLLWYEADNGAFVTSFNPTDYPRYEIVPGSISEKFWARYWYTRNEAPWVALLKEASTLEECLLTCEEHAAFLETERAIGALLE